MRVSDFSDGQVVLGHVIGWLDESVKNGKWEGETAFLRKDGSEFSARIKITPTKDKNGEHIGYCGVTTPLKDKTPDEVRPKIDFMTKILLGLSLCGYHFFCYYYANFSWSSSCKIHGIHS